MDRYIIFGKIGEGSFSEVFLGRFLGKNEASHYVAIKRLYPCRSTEKDIETHEIREIQVLKCLNPHPHIINLIDTFYDEKSKRHCMVTELMDFNLYTYVQHIHKGSALPEFLVKLLMWQLILALVHLHHHNYFHRDIKPENVLIKNDPSNFAPLLKLADFGGCCSTISKQPYTDYIATRWYRAPECLLTNGYYSQKVDTWSVGCVMFELLSGKPLFPCSNEFFQIQCIEALLGPLPVYAKTGQLVEYSLVNEPTQIAKTLQSLCVHCSSEASLLLSHLLAVNPFERISAEQALHSSFFDILRCPVPKPFSFHHFFSNFLIRVKHKIAIPSKQVSLFTPFATENSFDKSNSRPENSSFSHSKSYQSTNFNETQTTAFTKTQSNEILFHLTTYDLLTSPCRVQSSTFQTLKSSFQQNAPKKYFHKTINHCKDTTLFLKYQVNKLTRLTQKKHSRFKYSIHSKYKGNKLVESVHELKKFLVRSI